MKLLRLQFSQIFQYFLFIKCATIEIKGVVSFLNMRLFTGNSAKCPPPTPKPDLSLCNSKTQICRNGVSVRRWIIIRIILYYYPVSGWWLIPPDWLITVKNGVTMKWRSLVWKKWFQTFYLYKRLVNPGININLPPWNRTWIWYLLLQASV